MKNFFSVMIVASFLLSLTSCSSIHASASTAAVASPSEECQETYKLVKGSWQWAYEGGYVAHCDDRRFKGQDFKCKLDFIPASGEACTVAVERNITAPAGWQGTNQGPMPANFQDLFPGWQFGQSEIPPGEPSGKYGEVVAAKAWK